MTSSIAKTLSSLPLTDAAAQAPAQTRDDLGIAALSEGLARGDEDAFRTFHQRYFDRLYCFLLVVSRGCEDEAQEALQQTMVRVVRYSRRFSSEEVFWSWLKVLARSAARDAGRKRRRYASLLERFTFFREWQSQLELDPTEPDIRAILNECLAEFPPEDQQLVQSKYFAGETVREIATRLGATEKAIENRLGRLRQQLRHHLVERLRKDEC